MNRENYFTTNLTNYTAAAAVIFAAVMLLPLQKAQAVAVQGKGISFQAFIQDPAGEAINASNITVNAKILAPNGCVLREENFTNVTITDGYLNINITKGAQGGADPGLQITEIFKNTTALSSLTCLNDDNTTNGSLNSYTPSANDTRKLRITFANGADTILADFNMRSMPYAQVAESLNGKLETDFIQTSTNVTQTNLDTFMTAILQGACANGQVIKKVAGSWACANESGVGIESDPTVQNFAKNAPSTGLVVNGSNQLELSFGTIGGTAAQGNDSRITGAFQASTALGSDLSGTLPNPTVEKIKGQSITAAATTAGQVLRYAGGNNWTPGFVSMFDLRSTVTGSQTFGGGAAGCTAGQTLTWVAATDNLACANINITKSQVSDFPTFSASATTDTTNASNISSGTLAAARLPALAGDVTSSAGSNSITLNTVSVSKGGTGLTGAPTNGQILIGNGTGYTLATLTAGTGVTITNTAGGITISAASGVNGLRSCDTGNANDVMVAVGSWCVDKYEASVWSNADGSGTQYFSNGSTADFNYPNAGNLPASFNRNGSGSSVVYAASKPNVIPARGLTWYQAVVACANSGKVLIPDSVWQTAAIGTSDPGAGSGTGGTLGGSATDAAAAQCNINTHGAGNDNDSDGTWNDVNNKIRPTAKAGATNQGSNACISRFGVEDMVGNVWEWTDMNGVEAGTDASGFTQGENNASGSPFATADGTWNLNGSAYGCDGEGSTLGTCGWKNNVPAAAVRGGNWSNGAQAGVAALVLYYSGSVSGWHVGFRCARPR